MKTFSLFALLLLACGCAETREQTVAREKRIEDVEMKISRLIDLNKVSLDRIQRLEESYLSDIRSIQTQILLINRKLNQPGATAIEPVAPPVPQPEQKPSAQAAAAEAVKKLEGGAMVKDVALDILPMSKEIVPRLLEAVRKAKTERNFELTANIEAVISFMPPDDLKPALKEAIDDGSIRSSVVYIVASTKNKELGVLLEPLLDEGGGGEEERFAVAGALVQCGNKKGIPTLIKALNDDNETRLVAFDLLKKITGESFGYNIGEPPSANAAAIADWEGWWQNFGERFEFDK